MKSYYYAEGIIKISSPDPSFVTHYEWLLIQVEADNPDMADKKALQYFNTNYNEGYQGGVWIDQHFEKLVEVKSAIEPEEKEVMEIYSLSFWDLEAYKKWKYD